MNERTVAELPGRWRVRFLNGVLRGRTIGLKPGINVIGSAPDCDIVLHGDWLPQHLILSAGDIAISIQKVGVAAARLNGEELSLHRRGGASGDVISAGGVDFELDRMPDDARGPEHAHVVAHHPQAVDATLAAETPAGAALLQKDPVQPSGHAWRSGLVIIALGALTGIAGGFGWHALTGTEATASTPVVVEAPVPDWRDALVDFPELHVTAEPNGRQVLSGYVESRARKADLMAKLQAFSGRPDVNVQTAEDVLQQARRYIDDPGVNLRHAGGGQFILSGKVLNEAVRDKIRRLRQDLHSTLSLVDQVQYGPDEVQPGRERSLPVTTWENALPSRVVGMTEYADGTRHIQLANGDRYYEGAPLKSGNELMQIEAEAGRLTVKKSADAPQASAPDAPSRPR